MTTQPPGRQVALNRKARAAMRDLQAPIRLVRAINRAPRNVRAWIVNWIDP